MGDGEGRAREKDREGVIVQKGFGAAGPLSSPHQGLLQLESGDMGTGWGGGWGGWRVENSNTRVSGSSPWGRKERNTEVTSLQGQRQEPKEPRALTQVSPGNNYKERVSWARGGDGYQGR